jgi:hypothetical protein
MLLGQFPTLPLSLIHKTIAYYLENQAAVDDYLQSVEAKIEQQRASGTTLNVDELIARTRRVSDNEANNPWLEMAGTLPDNALTRSWKQSMKEYREEVNSLEAVG